MVSCNMKPPDHDLVICSEEGPASEGQELSKMHRVSTANLGSQKNLPAVELMALGMGLGSEVDWKELTCLFFFSS